jgi:type II secretory pathway pseudopilin PulG
MNRRRGFTLLELTMVFSVGMVIMIVSGTLLYSISRANSAHGDAMRSFNEVNRLAEKFRADARAATGLESLTEDIEGKPSKFWKFKLSDDRCVTYRPTPQGLDRIEYSDNRPTAYESFTLPERCAAEIAVETENQSDFAILRIAPEQTDVQLPNAAGSVRIKALLGKDLRFTK